MSAPSPAALLDEDAATALFVLPDSDGAFDPDHVAYLRELGRRRPSVLLAFPPKCAGTFLRSAAIHAVDGQLIRIVHAQGGRDATPYLPVFIRYLAMNFPPTPLVTHVHMQALPANRHFIEALDLKPVVMLRSVPDMLVSYLDMLAAKSAGASQWLNIAIPARFEIMDEQTKADFLIDAMLPWYASYYATWLAYAREAPGRVCVLRYGDFKADTPATLQTLLRHSGFEVSEEMCELAVAAAWHTRHENRFNKGIEGRGQDRLTPAQRQRIAHMLLDYYGLDAWAADLLPGG
jgi:sulfotransferase family protein